MKNLDLLNYVLEDNKRTIKNIPIYYQRTINFENKPSYKKIISINNDIDLIHTNIYNLLANFINNTNIEVNISLKCFSFKFNKNYFSIDFIKNRENNNLSLEITDEIRKILESDECILLINTYKEINKIINNYKNYKRQQFRNNEKNKSLLKNYQTIKNYLLTKDLITNIDELKEDKTYISVIMSYCFFEESIYFKKNNKIIKPTKNKLVIYFEKVKKHKVEDYINNSDLNILISKILGNNKYTIDILKNLEKINILETINNF